MINAEALIQEWHRIPGRTVTAFAHWKNKTGASSYEVLAQQAQGMSPGACILDLACGNGYLLELLTQSGFGHLIGVDFSAAEIAAAQARLGPAVDLRQESAQKLSLADQSIDMAVCHLALMLMRPLEPVLAEVARVLKAGGSFCMLNQRYLKDPAYALFQEERDKVCRAWGFDRLNVGDPRVFSAAAFGALLKAQPQFEEGTRVDDFAIETHGDALQLWESMRLMYDVLRLPEAARVQLKKQLLPRWQTLAEKQGGLTCTFGMRLTRVSKKKANRHGQT